MKKRNLFVFALASLMMIGCSNDDVIDEGGGNGNGADKGAWVSLSISAPAQTRAIGNPDDRQNGTEAESNISEVIAVFFKYIGSAGTVPLANTAATSDDFEKVDLVELSPAQIGKPGQGTTAGISGEAFEVKKGAEYILLVANPTTKLTAQLKNNAYTTFTQINAAIENDDVAVANKFVMTNAKGDLEPSVSGTDGSLKVLTLYDTKPAAEAAGAPLKITLDRVTAKVRLYNQYNNTADMKVHNVQWVLNVTNKKFFPISARKKTYREETLGGANIWSDPYALGSYRVDPNFTGNINPDDDLTNYEKEYTHYTETNKPSTWINPLDDATSPGTAQYCLENTQAEAENKHAYTTHILVKAVVYPSTLDSDIDNTSTDGTYNSLFKIGGAYYSLATLKTVLIAELTATDKPYIDAFETYLTGIGSSKTITSEAEINAIVEADLKADSHGSVTCFKNSINYYKIMIKHDNILKGGTDDPDYINKLGEFGVVRNSVYDIKITKFNNSGDPLIPNPDPDTDDEEDKKFLAVEIEVNPWTWYVQEVEL